MSNALVIGPNPHRTAASQVEVTQPIMGLSEEEFAKLAASIFIMVPHRPAEGINSGLAINFGFWARFGTTITCIEDQFGGFIEHTRANMAQLFRTVRRDRPELKYLVMIDADEKVPWDAPYRLAAWDEPIVSGIICSYAEQRGIFANVFVKDEFNVARMPSWNKTRNIPGKGLKECHSVGTGLICIRHDVLDKIIDDGETPFVMTDADRKTCFETGVLKVGEDTTFCAQARKRGFACYADFGVRGIHYKTIAIEWPQSHVDYGIDVRQWKVDPGDYHHG